MSKNQVKKADDALKEISADDILEPMEEKVQKTSLRREWEIRKLQENMGVSREIAEKMVDESRPRE